MNLKKSENLIINAYINYLNAKRRKISVIEKSTNVLSLTNLNVLKQKIDKYVLILKNQARIINEITQREYETINLNDILAL